MIVNDELELVGTLKVRVSEAAEITSAIRPALESSVTFVTEVRFFPLTVTVVPTPPYSGVKEVIAGALACAADTASAP
ncbi:MAG TPA: hypothetical protein PK453_00690 [Leptospiraceae bacterium]|nr:hypothetical protein [Leptospiraceae bacterium]HNI95835.1 hypothetical protein [Leptospiraceae bacterium]HNM05027.1 hypothetical protein [Leptospiraceae bacterium]